MFGKFGRKFPFFHRLPIRLRAAVSLAANIIDEIYLIPQLRLEKGWCFVDIGAHVGAYSILASRLVGRSGFVIAVEPDPDNFRGLLFNAGLLARAVIAVRAAIWNKNELHALFRSETGARSSLLPHTKTMDTVVVPCLTLDSLYQMLLRKSLIDRIDAIKIDVEGSEREVLEGSLKVMKMVKFLLLEVHDLRRTGQLITMLGRSGLRAESINSRYIIASRLRVES